jgi:hypothetical protein
MVQMEGADARDLQQKPTVIIYGELTKSEQGSGDNVASRHAIPGGLID